SKYCEMKRRFENEKKALEKGKKKKREDMIALEESSDEEEKEVRKMERKKKKKEKRTKIVLDDSNEENEEVNKIEKKKKKKGQDYGKDIDQTSSVNRRSDAIVLKEREISDEDGGKEEKCHSVVEESKENNEQKPSLLDLPDDIISQILKNLYFRDRMNVRVCERLEKLESKIGLLPIQREMKSLTIEMDILRMKFQVEPIRDSSLPSSNRYKISSRWLNIKTGLSVLKRITDNCRFIRNLILFRFDPIPYTQIIFHLSRISFHNSLEIGFSPDVPSLTSMNNLLLSWILKQSSGLKGISTRCNVIIAPDDLKNLRQKARERPGLNYISLSDVKESAVIPFADSTMGIEANQLMDPNGYSTHFPSHPVQKTEVFTKGRTLKKRKRGVTTTLTYEDEMDGRIGRFRVGFTRGL
ncbi:hypothetical protein PFISCL1PPCAC_3893, partial [Pristionchus fissidentatus]